MAAIDGELHARLRFKSFLRGIEQLNEGNTTFFGDLFNCQTVKLQIGIFGASRGK